MKTRQKQKKEPFASGRAHLLLDRLVGRRDDIGHDNLLSLAAAALAEGADGVAAGAVEKQAAAVGRGARELPALHNPTPHVSTVSHNECA